MRGGRSAWQDPGLAGLCSCAHARRRDRRAAARGWSADDHGREGPVRGGALPGPAARRAARLGSGRAAPGGPRPAVARAADPDRSSARGSRVTCGATACPPRRSAPRACRPRTARRAWLRSTICFGTPPGRLGRDPHPQPARLRAEDPGSILRSNYPADRFEVIVVDNASGDEERVELPDDVERRESRSALLREEAPGGSNARNAGLLAATGEIVAFADDDVSVDRDWLATLASGHSTAASASAPPPGLTLPGALETPAQVWYEGFANAGAGLRDRASSIAATPRRPAAVPVHGRRPRQRRELRLPSRPADRAGRLRPRPRTGTLTHDGEDVEALLRVLLADRQVVYEPRGDRLARPPARLRAVRTAGVGLRCRASPPASPRSCSTHPALLPELLRKLPGGWPTRSPRARPRTSASRPTTLAASPGSSCAAWPMDRSRMRGAAGSRRQPAWPERADRAAAPGAQAARCGC